MTNREIVREIADLQCRNHPFYPDGLFPSQRIHPWFPYKREDNNIFFSTLIIFTLSELRPYLDPLSQSLIDEMVTAVRNAQPLYQHWKGEGTYNFWMTNPSRHFPGGWLLHSLDRLAIPDDSDDSCLIHLTNEFSDRQSLWLKRKIENHYPSDRDPSHLTPHPYRHLKAYPTFFGKKLAPEMDACVICNVLSFMRSRGFSWSPHDKDSLEFLMLMLSRRDHLYRTFEVSPHYNHPVVILYHVVRLVCRFPHENFDPLKPMLKASLNDFNDQSLDFMEIVLLNICRLRMGLEIREFQIPRNPQNHFEKFFFFQAGMLTAFQKAPWKKLAGQRFFHLKYRCAAYYWTLLLEYRIWSQQRYSNP